MYTIVRYFKNFGGEKMVTFLVSGVLSAIISIIMGIIILIFPKILNYAVGLYLLMIGILFFAAQYGI